VGFGRALGIGLGLGLGLGLAVGIIFFLGREIEDRRARATAEATATAMQTQARAAATARAQSDAMRAQEVATASARRLEDEQRQAAASATAEAIRLAARRCQDPNKLVASGTQERVPNRGGFRYSVTGTLRNTCNYDIVFNLELTGLATNGSTIIATKTIAITAEGVGQGSVPSALIRPGEERAFSAYFVDRPEPDIASVRIAPVIVREGDPR